MPMNLDPGYSHTGMSLGSDNEDDEHGDKTPVITEEETKKIVTMGKISAQGLTVRR
jgi:hypothetical protein